MAKNKPRGSFELRGFYCIKLVADVCEKRNGSCALNCNGDLTLVLCASSGYSSGEDLGALAYALSESCYILIVDVLDLVGAEKADLLALASLHLGASCGSLGSICGLIDGGYNYFVIHRFLSFRKT